MSLPWSPEQREWLQALGHPLLVLAAGGSLGESPGAAGAGTQPPTPVAGPAAPAPAQPVPAAGHGGGSNLHRALLKATGLPAAEAEQALRSLGADPAMLRENPQAKRALWPRLRRLRRSRPT